MCAMTAQHSLEQTNKKKHSDGPFVNRAIRFGAAAVHRADVTL